MFPVGGLIKKAKAMIPKSVTAAAKTVVKKVADSATKIINRFEKNTSAATKALASIPAKVNATAKKAQAITQKVAAAVPKVVDAAKAAGKKQLGKIAEVNNVIKTSILTKAVEINSKNLRILDKLGQEAQNSLDRIHKGTGTLGAFYALNPNRTLYVGVDFLLTARETIIEEYPILNIGTEYSKNFISYMENQAKNLNDTIGSSVYNANIPIISDTVGAFTGQRDPNAESNIASMTGAFYRGLYVKGVGGTVDALANLAADPFEAIKGLNSIALEPEVMLPGLASLATEFVDKKIIHGSAEDRSEVAGQAVFEIAQFFIGTGEVKATTKVAEIGADAAKTSKALNLTTKANKLIKTEKLLNSTVFKGIKQTLSTTAKNSGCKAIESIDSMRLLFRNSSPNLALSYAGIGRLDDFVGTGELLQKGLSKIKSMASEIPVPKGVNIKGPKVSGKGVEEGAEKAVKVAGEGTGPPGGSFRDLMTPEEVARYDKHWDDVAETISNEGLDNQINYIKNGGITKPGGGQYKPSKISAAVDMNTGDIYYGYNGATKYNPSKFDIKPELRERIDYTKSLASKDINNTYADRASYELWSVDNCAEVYSVNNALYRGADIDNIFINTKYFNTGKYAEPCTNCQITFKGFKMPNQ